MPGWEYCTSYLSDLPWTTDEIALLNGAVENGLELVSITANNIAYLKRKVATPTAPSARSPRRKTTAG